MRPAVMKSRFPLVALLAISAFALAATAQAPAASAQNPLEAPPAAVAPTSAQTPSTRLLDEQPYDIVVLNDKERTTEKVLPLDLPGRRVPPAPKEDDVLRVRLWRAPERQFEIRWGDIAEVRLFERMLLDEAGRLAREGRFDEAFDYFTHLRSKPTPPEGLVEAEDAYFLAELRRDLEKGDAEKALAGCLRLHGRGSRSTELPGLFGRTIEAIVRRRLDEGKPTAARLAVDQMNSKFAGHPTVVRLRQEIADGAADLIRRAEEAAAAGRFGEAQRRIAEVLQMAPESQSARKLFERLVAEHPRVVVGVVGPAIVGTEWVGTASFGTASFGTTSLGTAGVGAGGEGAAGEAGSPRPLDWSASRIARLLRRPALDCVVGTGETPSVRYVPGWGTWSLDDRDPELARFETAAAGPSAYDVAAWLSEGSRRGFARVSIGLGRSDGSALGRFADAHHARYAACSSTA
jgi:hypothetical protein